MKVFLPLAFLLVGAAPAKYPRSYLLSIGHFKLKESESVGQFSIKTWGVDFISVCKIPSGWRIKAGSGATPDGEIEGEGSVGATWFRQSSPKELRNLLLVKMYAPVQRNDIGSMENGIPATFKGAATINSDDSDPTLPLTYKNVTLKPAAHCPIR